MKHAFDYADLDDCLALDEVEAVYIALPNDQHREYAERAARAGVHVLCEKPMALSSGDCGAMISAARDGDVRLMIAYRLHFEPANLAAVEVAQSGKLGELKFFTSEFSFQVSEDNIRTMVGARRRAALGHRHLLHQRRPLPLPERADRGVRDRDPRTRPTRASPRSTTRRA